MSFLPELSVRNKLNHMKSFYLFHAMFSVSISHLSLNCKMRNSVNVSQTFKKTISGAKFKYRFELFSQEKKSFYFHVIRTLWLWPWDEGEDEVL